MNIESAIKSVSADRMQSYWKYDNFDGFFCEWRKKEIKKNFYH